MVKILADDNWKPAEQLELFPDKDLRISNPKNNDIPRCCGTCRFWIVEPAKSFTERLKERFKPLSEPYCRHNNKPRIKTEGTDCLGYKEAEQQQLVQR